MIGSPRAELEIDPLKKRNILRVVFPHDGPGLWVPLHAALPHMKARMREFAPHSKIGTERIKSIAIEFEMPPGDLEGVDRLEWRRRVEAMEKETSAELAKIEPVAVVRNDDIGTVKHLPGVLNEVKIVTLVLLVAWVVYEALRSSLFLP